MDPVMMTMLQQVLGGGAANQNPGFWAQPKPQPETAPNMHMIPPTPMGPNSWLRGLMPKMQPPIAATIPVDFGKIPDFNLKTTVGQMPQFTVGPTPIPAPVGPNLGPIKDLINGGFNVGDFTPIQAPLGRPQHKFADVGPFVEAMKSLKPQNQMESEQDFKNTRFRDSIAAAAMAAAQGDSFGETLALAGGAFGATAGDANKRRKQEQLQFSEIERGWNMEMAQLDYEAAQAKVEMENATTDLEYASAMDKWTTAESNRQAKEAYGDKVRQAQLQKAGMMLDFATAEADVANARNQTAWQNEESKREFFNAEAAKRVGTWEISKDGTKIYRTSIGEKGEVQLSEEPFGEFSAMNQLVRQVNELFGPAAGAQIKAQSEYEKIAQMFPQYLRRRVISDILKHPKGIKIFDPEDTANLNWGEATLFGGNIIRDKFETSLYERVETEAERYIDASISRGLIPPEAKEQALYDAMAMGLENSMTPAMLARAKKQLNDPVVNYGIDLMSKQK